MPYPSNFVRCAITATLQDGESMVHTFHIKDVTPPGSTVPSLQVLADGLVSKWTSGMTTVAGASTWASLLAPQTKYQKVTVYRMDETTGRAKDLAEAGFGATAVGGAAATLPTEIALCATTTTGAPGRSRRGRLYLGGLSTSTMITATGRVSAPAALTASTFLSRFFRAVRDIDVSTGEQDKWEPQVVSLTNTSARKITGVSVGDVFDVQRRRRNKISEARQTTAVG